MSARHGQPRPSNGGHRPAPLSEQGRRGPPNRGGPVGGGQQVRRPSSKNRHSRQAPRNPNPKANQGGRDKHRGRDSNGRYISHQDEEERRSSKKPRQKEWRHPVDPVYLSMETGFPLQANAEIYETIDFSRYQFKDISPILVDFFKLTSRPGTIDLEAPVRRGIGLIPVIARHPNGEEKMHGDIPSSKATYIGGGHDRDHHSSRSDKHGHRDERYRDDRDHDDRISAEDIKKGRHHPSSRRRSRSRGRENGRRSHGGGAEDEEGYYSSGQNSYNDDSQSDGGASQTNSYDSQADDYYSSGEEEGEGDDDYDSYDDNGEEGQDNEYGVRAAQASQHSQQEYELFKKQQLEEVEKDAAMAAQYANMAAQQKRQKVFQYRKLLNECRRLQRFPIEQYIVPDPDNESIGTLADLIFNMSDARTKHEWIEKRTGYLVTGGMALSFVNKMLLNSKIGLEPNDNPESNTFIGKWAKGVADCQPEFDRLFETQLQQKGSMAAMRDNPYVSMGVALGQSVFKEHSKNRWGFDMDNYLGSGVLQDGPNQGVFMYPPQQQPPPPPTAAAPSDPNAGFRAPPPPQTYANPADTYPTQQTQPNRQAHSNTNVPSSSNGKSQQPTATQAPPQTRTMPSPPQPIATPAPPANTAPPPSQASLHNMPGFIPINDQYDDNQDLAFEDEIILQQMIEQEALKV